MPTRPPTTAPVLSGFSYLRPLGSGGFADVYLYEQDLPRRQVAVKVLPPALADADVRRMFNAEADVLARLSAHPSILTVYQAGVSADGRPYIVMEYCPTSLGERYRRERIPVAEALAVGVKVAGALETAHRVGLMHRDVKPSNILLTEFGVPVLSDFGIAASLTASGADELFAMSVPWSAPEVIAEHTAGSVASEVWGLGATVYSLLAGRSPFERDGAGQNTAEQLRRRIVRAAYVPTGRTDVPPALEEVLARALQRDPGARFATAGEFAAALQAVQRDLGQPQTVLDVAPTHWADAGVDFSDSELRGPVRASVAHPTSRKPSGAPRLGSRTAESGTPDATAAATRPAWPWLLVGAGATVAVVVLFVLLHLWRVV
ncbi:MAG: serine/threonine-protein kinase [Propionicimonas sp.]|uniref:serine/threonine-protein kinase n=1 Tax=Propionicimonas sp. TaxID=1955623 RepID=UPI003D14938E